MDDIKLLTKSPENLTVFKNNKEKVYLTYIKPDVKTKTYNTVKDDNLSPTLYAYYNCEKNRQILSDKDAATMRVMRIDNNIDLTDENIGFNPPIKGKKEREGAKDNDNVI